MDPKGLEALVGIIRVLNHRVIQPVFYFGNLAPIFECNYSIGNLAVILASSGIVVNYQQIVLEFSHCGQINTSWVGDWVLSVNQQKM